MKESISNEAGEALSAVGLAITLSTIFTAELARRLTEANSTEQTAKEAFPSIERLAAALSSTTIATHIGLWPLAWSASASLFDSTTIDPTVWLFATFWLLLNALLNWQIDLTSKSHKYGEVRAWMLWSAASVTVICNASLLVHGVAG